MSKTNSAPRSAPGGQPSGKATALLLLPPMAYFLVYFFYPIVVELWASFFTGQPLIGVAKFTGFGNYLHAFSDPRAQKAFVVTLAYAVGTTVFTLVPAVGLLAAQAFPTVIEYQAALKAINKAKEGATVADVRKIFDKAADVDNITSVKGEDLQITKQGDEVVISFAYDKEFHMFGPAYMVLKYRGQSRPGR